MSKRRRKVTDSESEDAHQIAVAQYLDALGVLWAHVPNEGKRSKVTGGRLKAKGMKAGVPDILIFTTPPDQTIDGARVGVAIELKRPGGRGRTLRRWARIRGSACTGPQGTWMVDLATQRWSCWVCFGLDEVREVCRWLGYDRSKVSA